MPALAHLPESAANYAMLRRAVTGLPARTSFSYHSVPQGQSNDLTS
jgi:hypothetical protein